MWAAALERLLATHSQILHSGLEVRVSRVVQAAGDDIHHLSGNIETLELLTMSQDRDFIGDEAFSQHLQQMCDIPEIAFERAKFGTVCLSGQRPERNDSGLEQTYGIIHALLLSIFCRRHPLMNGYDR